MLSKTRVFLTLALIFILLNKTSAQKLNDLTPPSPKAYELGKYGQTPVGLFTGTLNPSVPIYTYRTKNLEVPIFLSYSSNGLKVDDVGSNVGLGWSLNVGGVVTRIVRDLPDNDRTDFFPDDKMKKTGWINSVEALNYFKNAGDNADIDTETDLYMFNFNGYSGKFVFDNNHNIVMIPKQDIKIETTSLNNKDGFKITAANGVIYLFQERELTRSRVEGLPQQAPPPFYPTSWYLSSIKHPNGDEVTFVYEAEGYNYLTSKQQTLSTVPLQTGCLGQQIPTSHTESGIFGYRLSVSGVRLKEIQSNIAEEGKVLITSGASHPEIGGYQLVSALQVVDKNNAEMERADFTYILTPNKRAFLQKVAMKDPNNNYTFTYDDQVSVPARLSPSQDHWGYFNNAPNINYFPNVLDPKYMAPDVITTYFLQNSNKGANKDINSNFTSKGMLTRVTYPTKGYSHFTYEANTYRGIRTDMPPQVSLDANVEAGYGNLSHPTDSKSSTAVNFDQEARIYLNIGGSGDPQCPTPPDPIHTVSRFTITDLTAGGGPSVYQKTSSGNTSLGNTFILYFGSNYNLCYVHLTAGHAYKITIEAMHQCVSSSVSLQFYQGAKTQVPANLITGGLRVRKVETNDGINAASQTTFYYYGKKETPDVSTGEEAVAPSYVTTLNTMIDCPPNQQPSYSYEVSSNSLNSLYNSIGTNSPAYQFVTVSMGGDNFQNGGEEHEFILDQDAPANNIKGDYILSAPWTNIGFANGKEKTVNTFKKSGAVITLVKKVSNTYVLDPRYHQEVYGFVVQKKYNTQYTVPVSYTCTGEFNISYDYYKCTTNHDITNPVNGDVYHVGHNWGILPWWSDWKCIAPGANNVLVVIPDQCFGQPDPTVLTNPSSLDNLNISQYITNSDWEYLSSTSTTDYDLSGANPITTTKNLFYDNPVHLQLTRTETTAGGNVIKEKMYYPDDVTTVSSLPGGDLQGGELITITSLNRNNQYRINTPVQIETYQGNFKRKTVRTIYQTYNGLILPSIVKTLTGEASSTNVLRDNVYYYNYDAKGNILEAAQVNDVSTSYLWGYNGLYPIAVAKNAKANEILFSGFEEAGGWVPDVTAYDATRSYSGKYSGRIDNATATEKYCHSKDVAINTNGNTVRYKYSAWVYSTGPVVDLFFLMRDAACMALQPPCYASVATHVTTNQISKWVYLEGEYDVPANTVLLNVRIDNNGNGTVWFDDVRLHPSAAQMSTYTFQPLTGITSETLPNQQVKKYEYDFYNRLKLTRNGDNAILQRFQYKFK
jgi:hypothetical protein